MKTRWNPQRLVAARAHLLLLLALLAIAPGCRRPAATIRAPVKSTVIVAFGDSLTSGETGGTGGDYPTALQHLLGCRVVNAGVSGEASAEGLVRLPRVLRKHRPDLVILCHGGNDLLAKGDEAALERNVEAMVARCRENGADVLLVGVPKPSLRLSMPPLYADIARRNRIPYEGRILKKILSTRSLKSDHVHPNAKGYGAFADAMAALIRKSS